MTVIKNCKGCYVINGCIYKEHSTLCPCSICLIKVVCREICDEHLDFQIKTKRSDFIRRIKQRGRK
jgi:hypothetical protein